MLEKSTKIRNLSNLLCPTEERFFGAQQLKTVEIFERSTYAHML
jgi:hypothetical protein